MEPTILSIIVLGFAGMGIPAAIVWEDSATIPEVRWQLLGQLFVERPFFAQRDTHLEGVPLLGTRGVLLAACWGPV